jgi:hypothetical protein
MEKNKEKEQTIHKTENKKCPRVVLNSNGAA